MAEPLVRFYELSGPKPWSPFCWMTRFVLNYKGIPYTTVKISYPKIKPTVEKLLPSMDNVESTVPIIEVLGPDYKALNDSVPIANYLNERFTEKDGFKFLAGLDEIEKYAEKTGMIFRPVSRWITYDIYKNGVLDPNDGSKEYFKNAREQFSKCQMKDIIEVRAGGETALWKDMHTSWEPLRERVKGEDGSGEPTYVDFWDAALVKWVQAASQEKYERLLELYGDDTFTKLMKKVEKYSDSN